MATEGQAPDETPTKIIISGTNGEILHEDPSERPKDSSPQVEGAASSPGADINGPESTDQSGETLPKPVIPPISIDEYLEKHKIKILFEELISRTLDKTPENPLKFLASSLEKMEEDNWQPGESFLEKAEAVQKVFQFRVKTPDPEKTDAKGARPASGSVRGPTGKVGTSSVRGTGPKTTSTPAKTANPPKTGTGPSTVRLATGRTTTTTTQPKTGAGARPATTPAKTPAKTTTTTPPRTTTTGRTGTTGGAPKTGTTSTTTRPPATKTSTGPGRTATATTSGRAGATGGAGAKTGSNTSINKAPATKTPATTRTTTAPPRTGVKTTSNTGARGTTAPRPVGAGRTTSGTRTTGGATKTGALGAGGRTKSGQLGKPGPGAKKGKEDTPAIPEPETESEPKVPTPPVEEVQAPPVPEEEPQPKPPVDDGLWSQIPGSEAPAGPAQDSDDLLAKEEVHYDSEDEPPKAATDSPVQPLVSVDTDASEPAEKPEGFVSTDQHMTSQDLAREVQDIENNAETNVRQNLELNELADEGIDVDPETLFTPKIESGHEKIYSSEELASGKDGSLVLPGIPAVPAASEPDKKGDNVLESPPQEQQLELGADAAETQRPKDPSPDLTVETEKDTQPGSDGVKQNSPSPPKPASPAAEPALTSIEQTFENAVHSATIPSPNASEENLTPSPSNQSPVEPGEKLIPLPADQPPVEPGELPTNQSPVEQDQLVSVQPTNEAPVEKDEQLPTSHSPSEQDEKIIPLPTSEYPVEKDEQLIPLPTNASPVEKDEQLIPLPTNASPFEKDDKLIPSPSNQSPTSLGPDPVPSSEPNLSTIDMFEAQILGTKQPPATTNPFEQPAVDTNTQAPGFDD